MTPEAIKEAETIFDATHKEASTKFIGTITKIREACTHNWVYRFDGTGMCSGCGDQCVLTRKQRLEASRKYHLLELHKIEEQLGRVE